LSMRSVFPRILAKEQAHGSLVRSMFSGAGQEDIWRDLKDCPLVRRSMAERWAVFSFHHGMQSLSAGLCRFVSEQSAGTGSGTGVELMPGTRAASLQFRPDRVEVKAVRDGKPIDLEVEHVFSSIPATKLAPLLT